MTAGGRAVGISGCAFVVLFIGGGLLLGELFGQFGDSDQTFVDYYADRANRVRDIIGGFLLVAAGLALLVFFNGLARLLRGPGGAQPEPDLALLSGTVGVTLLLTGAVMLSAVSFTQAFGDFFDDDALTNLSITLAPQIGYLLIALPMAWSLALTMAVFGWSARRAAVWPRWLLGLTVACVILLPLLAFSGGLLILLPLWVAGVSVWSWRQRSPA